MDKFVAMKTFVRIVEAGSLDEWIAPLRELIEDGSARPLVAEAFPFDRAAEAHRMIAERRNVGKVVLVP